MPRSVRHWQRVAIRTTVPVEEQLSLLPFKIGDMAGFQVGGVIPGRGVALGDAPGAAALPGTAPYVCWPSLPADPRKQGTGRPSRATYSLPFPNVRDVRLTSSEPMRIVGQPGHQILAEGKDATGTTNLTVVQWLRFGGGGYLSSWLGSGRSSAGSDHRPLTASCALTRTQQFICASVLAP